MHEQVVIVTGASSGIGAAVARAVSARGGRVVLAARRGAQLQSLADAIPGEALVVVCDVTSETDVSRLVRQTIDRFGRIDGLVNNAGYGSFAPVVDTDLGEWRQMIDVNVTGSFLCARAVLPGMLERRCGWIVNICSDVSRRVFAGGGAYCASKHAQYALSLAMNAECRPHGVRVGAVLPGMVATEFAGGDPQEREAWVLRSEDIAEAVVFMATRPAHAVVDELTVHPVRQEY